MGSWKPGIKNCKLGKEGSNLFSVTERMSTFLDIKSQKIIKFILDRIYVDVRKDYVPRIFYS